MLSTLIELIFPKYCLICHRLGSYLCWHCRESLQIKQNQNCPYCRKISYLGLTHPGCKRRQGVDGLFVFYHYRGPVQKLIKKIKYRLVRAAIEEVVQAIPQNSVDQLIAFIKLSDQPLLIPVPLHKKRQNWRGFNQSEELSSILSGRVNMGVNTTAAIRIKNTPPQAQLSRKERYNNIRGAFAQSEDTSIKNRDCFIVDDVWSSGSTAKELTKTLKKAGARKVYTISLAT